MPVVFLTTPGFQENPLSGSSGSPIHSAERFASFDWVSVFIDLYCKFVAKLEQLFCVKVFKSAYRRIQISQHIIQQKTFPFRKAPTIDNETIFRSFTSGCRNNCNVSVSSKFSLFFSKSTMVLCLPGRPSIAVENIYFVSYLDIVDVYFVKTYHYCSPLPIWF